MSLKISTFNIAWLQGEGSDGVDYKKHAPIHFKSGLSVISSFIKEHELDFIALQEVDFDCDRSHNINQLQILQEKTNYYGVKTVSWDISFLPFPYFNPWRKIRSGGACLSKYPITIKEEVLFDAPDSMFFLKKPLYIKRYIQVIEIHKENKIYTAFNLHLEAFDIEEKYKQIQILFDLVKKHNPDFILGDFNTIHNNSNQKKFSDMDYSSDKSFTLLYNGLNSYKNSIEKLTFPKNKPDRQLDYIFIKKEINNENIEADFFLNPSDHKPLVVKIL
jgi:endonuclease/exonuclease/phosphatase family metal-dependent hydrolase